MNIEQHLELSLKIITKLGWKGYNTYFYTTAWWGNNPLLPALKLNDICLN